LKERAKLFRELMRPGDIILSRNPRGKLNRIIRWVTGKRWREALVDHAAMVGVEGTLIEAVGGGVEIGLYTDRYRKYEIWCRVMLPDDVKLKACEWARDQVGKAYDALQLPGILLAKIFHKKKALFDDPNKFVCSELIAEAYEKGAGVKLVERKHESVITPQDLFEAELTNPVKVWIEV